MNQVTVEDSKSSYLDNAILVLLLFFIGLMNSRYHIAMLGIPYVDKIIELFFGFLLIINILIIIFGFFLGKKKTYMMPKYWWPLILIIILKYFILFLEKPHIFYPKIGKADFYAIGQSTGIYFQNAATFIINFLVISILARRIDNFPKLQSSITAFGLGCSIAPIIGLVFFPNLIGKRISYVNGRFFGGSFWNAAVIAFISSGWLLIANTYNDSTKLKKFIDLFLVITMLIGGIAGLSRAIIVAGVISILMYMICSKKIENIFKTIIVLVILILIVQTWFNIIFENFKYRLDSGLDIKGESRIAIWKDYIEDIPTYFFFGAPIEGHKIFSKLGYGPHSVLLNWWSQFGIFAVIAFLWLIWGLWKSALYIFKKQKAGQGAAVYAWIVAYLSIAMINETGFKELPFYTAMGIVFAWGNLAKYYK